MSFLVRACSRHHQTHQTHREPPRRAASTAPSAYPQSHPIRTLVLTTVAVGALATLNEYTEKDPTFVLLYKLNNAVSIGNLKGIELALKSAPVSLSIDYEIHSIVIKLVNNPAISIKEKMLLLKTFADYGHKINIEDATHLFDSIYRRGSEEELKTLNLIIDFRDEKEHEILSNFNDKFTYRTIVEEYRTALPTSLCEMLPGGFEVVRLSKRDHLLSAVFTSNITLFRVLLNENKHETSDLESCLLAIPKENEKKFIEIITKQEPSFTPVFIEMFYIVKSLISNEEKISKVRSLFEKFNENDSPIMLERILGKFSESMDYLKEIARSHLLEKLHSLHSNDIYLSHFCLIETVQRIISKGDYDAFWCVIMSHSDLDSVDYFERLIKQANLSPEVHEKFMTTIAVANGIKLEEHFRKYPWDRPTIE